MTCFRQSTRALIEWQPIETAPQDGVRFLGLSWDGVIKQGYIAEGWCWAEQSSAAQEFTHWMPLPAPPSAAKTCVEEGHTLTPLRLLEEHEAKVKALQDALIAGEQSGEPRPFDFDSFKARKRAEFEAG
jgi:hypothetical protein